MGNRRVKFQVKKEKVLPLLCSSPNTMLVSFLANYTVDPGLAVSASGCFTNMRGILTFFLTVDFRECQAETLSHLTLVWLGLACLKASLMLRLILLKAFEQPVLSVSRRLELGRGCPSLL